VELSAPSTAKVGTPVPLILRLTNHTRDSILPHPLKDSSGNLHAHVFRPDGTQIWQRIWGQLDGPAWDRRLAPGDFLEFSASWDQRDDSGRQVPPGEYVVQGRFRWDENRKARRRLVIEP
jgi:hypothetical protein